MRREAERCLCVRSSPHCLTCPNTVQAQAYPNLTLTRCPDGYRGGWQYDAGQSDINPSALEALREAEDDFELTGSVGTKWGYEDFQQEFDGNPFSNKVILMDEVHNLINPSPDILKNEKRSAMLTNLKFMLQTAKNSVLVCPTHSVATCNQPRANSRTICSCDWRRSG